MSFNGLEVLEPGANLFEIQGMFSVLASLSTKCDDLQRGQKEIPSLSLTNQRRLHVIAGRIASLKVVLERRAAETPSRNVTHHPSDAFLSSTLPSGWERSFTEDDIPYYVNHIKEVLSFCHFLFAKGFFLSPPFLFLLYTFLKIGPFPASFSYIFCLFNKRCNFYNKSM